MVHRAVDALGCRGRGRARRGAAVPDVAPAVERPLLARGAPLSSRNRRTTVSQRARDRRRLRCSYR
jgi:hypothetical protein